MNTISVLQKTTGFYVTMQHGSAERLSLGTPP